MATKIAITGFSVSPENGRVFINWDDGSQSEYPSIDSLRESVSLIDSRMKLCKEIVLAYWLSREPGLVDGSVVVGVPVTFDLSKENPISFGVLV